MNIYYSQPTQLPPQTVVEGNNGNKAMSRIIFLSRPHRYAESRDRTGQGEMNKQKHITRNYGSQEDVVLEVVVRVSVSLYLSLPIPLSLLLSLPS